MNELKKNGRSAISLCFVPAVMEIIGYVVFGMSGGSGFDFNVLWRTPVSIILGIAIGLLTAAVLAIIITAPVGAFLIVILYKKLLSNESMSQEYVS